MDLQTPPSSPPTLEQPLRAGKPAKVVLLADRPLLAAMRETLEAVRGVQVAGAFSSSHELVDWVVWKRGEWQLAFIDFALPGSNPAEATTNLLSQPAPGEVVALGAARWPEMQQACATMGIHRILDRGNLAHLRGFLREWVQHG